MVLECANYDELSIAYDWLTQVLVYIELSFVNIPLVFFEWQLFSLQIMFLIRIRKIAKWNE